MDEGISVAHVLELGVSITWQQAVAVTLEAWQAAVGADAVEQPAQLHPESCVLTVNGDVVLVQRAAGHGPDGALKLLRAMLVGVETPPELVAVALGTHGGRLRDELAAFSHQDRRVEVADLAKRGLAARAAMPIRLPAARGRELLVLATIMAGVLWGITAFDASSGTGRGRLSGLPIGTDFVNFYALAHVGQSDRYEALASFDSFRQEQRRLLPSAADTFYPPVYPPQVALVLSPLAHLSYGRAYLAWLGATLLLYGGCVTLMLRGCIHLRSWPRQVAAVAVASPALWLVVMHGQVSAVALLALVGMWLALRARRPWVAGFALGLLAFKPSLFVPALILLVASGEWRMALGASLGAVVQYGLVIPWGGVNALLQYVTITLELLRSPDLVASNPPLMHSLRTFWTGLVPPNVASLAYAVTSIVVVAHSAVAWRRISDALARTAIMSAVVALTSPHLFVYDLLILTPLLLASSERSMAMPEQKGLRSLTYAGYFLPVLGIPISSLGLQASSVALWAWLYTFASVSGQAARAPVSTRRSNALDWQDWSRGARRTDGDHRGS